jgi:C1A family cysteine protease
MPTITPNGHGLGRTPDLGDIRDHPLSLRLTAPANLPAVVDLRPRMPPVGDQGRLGSCTAWASTAAWRAELMKQGKPDMEPSELATYYWTRSLEGTTKVDAGASIRDAIKSLAKVGCAPEELWPYDIARFAKAPPAAVKKAAGAHQALEYQAVPQMEPDLKAALAEGYAVVIGISVYESFESPAANRTGIIPLPKRSERLLGGHAIALVGYDDPARYFTFRNSWGTGWGDKGYGYLPYDYVLSPSLASDFWIVRLVEAA